MHQLQLLLSLLIYSSLVGNETKKKGKNAENNTQSTQMIRQKSPPPIIGCVHKRFIKYIGFKQRLKRTPNGCLKFQN